MALDRGAAGFGCAGKAGQWTREVPGLAAGRMFRQSGRHAPPESAKGRLRLAESGLDSLSAFEGRGR